MAVINRLLSNMPRNPGSSNIKIALLVLALGIVIALLLYTQNIVRQLQEKEHRYADLYVKALEYLGSEQASENPDLTLITEEIINKIDFPVIIADPNRRPSGYKNIDVDTALKGEALTAFLEKRMEAMSDKPPLVLTYQDTIVTQYVYYDESTLVKQLRILPYIEIAVAALFIFIGYVSFSYIKRTEQANIWVGMAKETAHQLGTPLSSLLGWLTLLRETPALPSAAGGLLEEMRNDVERLQRIALRFSKIGSRPELTPQNVRDIVDRSIAYYTRRLPKFGKKVDITCTDTGGDTRVLCNAELLEWVFENLLKNALEAIEGPSGRIDFLIHTAGSNAIIDVSDTGKGIDLRTRKDIFRPGYSTKKRGWGLGLSLSRRIVEDYHKGKIFVLTSDPRRGTTFRIKLRKA
ncbi:MAG: HAMP domain-containing sensor histidine kinase [Bacteroidota bacterium]|nr:HAMP domain-containing sensor histidine kinase [Bacteroidota bacterium]